MTVEELLKLNGLITDVVIEVRINGSRLLDELHIGPDFGVVPPNPTQVPVDEAHVGGNCKKDATYIDKSINTWDDGKDYWQLRVERIPKKWRELEVFSWRNANVYKPRHGRYSINPNGDYNGIRIVALPSGESLKVEEKETTGNQLEGQMNLEDFLA